MDLLNIKKPGRNDEGGSDPNKERAKKLDKAYMIGAFGLGILLILSYVNPFKLNINLASIFRGLSSINANFTEKRGNTIGNSSNDGLSVINGDWIYYVNIEDENRIYRVKKDGSEKSLYIGDSAENLNIHKNKLFYINKSDKGKIYSVSLKDGKKELFLNCSASNLIIYGSWVYYIKEPQINGEGSSQVDFNNIFRIRIDGSKNTNLISKTCTQFNISKGWIYFINSIDQNKIFKAKLNGSEISKVSDRPFWKFWMDGKYIYFSSGMENYMPPRFMRIPKNGGSEEELLNSSEVTAVNTMGDSIYFSSGTGVYAMDKKSKKINMIDNNSNSFVSAINTSGDWVYCLRDNNGLFKVNILKGVTEKEEEIPKKILISGVSGDKSDGEAKYCTREGNNIARDDEWIYYFSSGGLRRAGINKDSVQTLSDVYSNCIDVNGDYIYYIDNMRFNKIFRVKKDGSGKEEFFNERVSSFMIYGDFLYYTKIKDEFGLYRIKLDGSSSEKLLNDRFDRYYVLGNQVYYNQFNSRIFKVDLDIKSIKSISNDLCEKFIVSRGYIYYFSLLGEKGIYRINIDGSGKKKIIKGNYSPIGATKNCLYLQASGIDKVGLVRTSLEGKNVESFETIPVSGITLDKSFYYYDNSSGRIKVIKENY